MIDLNVALFQIDVKWENKKENLSHITNLFNQLDNSIDVILLPEMFTTGFTMNFKSLAETMNGKSISWMKENSAKYKALLIGSLIIEDSGNFYNRLICSFPNGNISFYDKHHLFRPGGENDFYTKGEKKLIIEYKKWNICPLVCYDLRFPVWSRNSKNSYDMLIYIASWPAKRREHWIKLLQSRAIENQSYVIGLNRVGTDGNNIKYTGDSMAVNSNGEILNPVFENKEEVIICNLSKNELVDYRNKLPFYLDEDNFELK